jgi:hypothetical protein
MGEFCDKCPEGYEADYSCFHFPNCSAPTTWYLITFILHSICLPFSLLYIYTTAIGLRSEALQLVKIYAGLNVTYWVLHLCLFIQNGMHEAGLVAQGLAILHFVYFGTRTLLFVLAPVYAIARSPMTQVSRAYYLLCGFLVACTCVPNFVAIAFARDPDPATYNTVYSAFGVALGATMVIYPVVGLVNEWRLRRVLESIIEATYKSLGKRDTSLEAVLLRLKYMRYSLLFMICGAAIPYSLSIVVVFVLKSMPMLYLIATTIVVSPISMCYPVMMFLNSKPPAPMKSTTRVKTATGTSPTIEHQVVASPTPTSMPESSGGQYL